jgi:hypothetical protein
VTLVPVTAGARKKFGALTTEEGKFSISPIDPGTYRVTVERSGYLTPSGRGEQPATVHITEQPPSPNLKLQLMPEGIIAGLVRDAEGDPAERADVEAIRGSKIRASVQTDDRGAFRLSGLAPGFYRVRVTPRTFEGPPEIRPDGSVEVYYGTTFFPSAPSLQQAQPIEVGAGRETSGVEILLRKAPITRISGVLAGVPNGPWQPWVNVSPLGADWSTDREAKGGKFTFWRLARGRYRITGEAMSANRERRRSAPYELEVSDTDIDGIELVLLPKFNVAGRIAWDTAKAPNNLPALSLKLEPLDSSLEAQQSDISSADDFTVVGLFAGRYRVSVIGAPEVAYLKSLALGVQRFDNNVVDLSRGTNGNELSITLSLSGAEITGSVQDSRGDPAAGSVALFREVSASAVELVRTTPIAPDGTYAIRGLATGAYRVVAFDESDRDDVLDSPSIETYQRYADKLRLAEGEKATRPLRVAPSLAALMRP